MNSNPLVDYIKSTLRQGYSQEQITQHLIDNGYSNTDIEHAFHTLKHTHIPHHFIFILISISILCLIGVFFASQQLNTTALHFPTSEKPHEIVELESTINTMQNQTQNITQTDNYQIKEELEEINCNSTTFFQTERPLLELQPQTDNAIMCFGKAIVDCHPAKIQIQTETFTNIQLTDTCEIRIQKDNITILCPNRATSQNELDAFFQMYSYIPLELEKPEICSIQ